MNRATQEYAAFPIRLLAVLIDTLLLLFVSIILTSIIQPFTDALFFHVLLNLIVTASLYSAFLSSGWQATPGKRIMKIYVMKKDGRPLSRRDALERYLAYIMPSLPLYSSMDINAANVLVCWLGLFWYLPALLTKQKTALHDMLCNTRVVQGKAENHR